MNWHYVQDGEPAGPVTDTELAELNRSGKINADTLVWCDGMANWQPFRDIKLSPPSPSPLPPPAGRNSTAADAASDPGQTKCAECGNMFPTAETIRYGQVNICAACKPVFLQKLAEGAHIDSGQMNYAGFGVRFGAKLLDGLILGIPMMVVIIAVIIPSFRNSANRVPQQIGAVQFLPMLIQFGFLFIIFAYRTFFLGKFGATPGKMACKLRVVTAEGAPIGYGRAACRALAEMLSGMICYIGYFMVLFDGQKRALHDHLCGTRVIQKPS